MHAEPNRKLILSFDREELFLNSAGGSKCPSEETKHERDKHLKA
jgi:hypothetical protein